MFEKLESKDLYRGSVPFFLSKLKGKTILLCSSNKNIEDYYGTIKEWYKGSILKVDNVDDENDNFKKKYKFLDILEKEKQYIILTSLKALLSDFFYEKEEIIFSLGKKIDINLIEKKLIENGYKKRYLIENTLEYSIRGDVLDIYSLSLDFPIRIEFFGEEIDRINFFDINTQKSIENKEKINMYIMKNKEKKYSFIELLNYYKKEKINLYLENQEILNYKIEDYILQKREEEEKYKKRYEEIIEKFIKIETKRLDINNIKDYENIENVKEESKEKKIIIFTLENRKYSEIFKNNKNILVKKYSHFEGFYYKGKLILTDREIKGIRVKKELKIKKSLKYNSINQIRKDDYIIHESFGVGRYLGVETIKGSDYLMIQYAGEDKLYVPIENLNKIEKYICEIGKTPEIYNLGRKGFKRKRLKLEDEMQKFAKEIINIQAKRKAKLGFAFSKDTIWQEEFEDLFPYTETKDQKIAIEEVKKDMESFNVMDRIICGDVGFGKTEVAMRATFKCITDNKQVLIITPTTVLAEQHYNRFKERFCNYPINISLMNRTKTQKEQKEISSKIYIGGVDVVIGTHRLLSNDIKFKELGLIIIDEEQKFGVKAKEKLKKMKENVDMLTLTATPIPRTLNLALLGIRDFSIIKTPPINRKAIKNMFMIKNKKNLKEAILKEIGREGQVFYVYNSVNKMNYKFLELKETLPEYIKIAYIHGRMEAKKIREIIYEFENGDIDVLLTTTIIENGIDIENANTIIIEGIEKLGLSQIYQLRGRVGRGEKQAYCYLLEEEEKKYSKKTLLRKKSIEKIKNLGSGFELSLEDMNIRGAGEILGEKQHGAIESFGFNLYLKLLNKEILKIKGDYKEKQEIVFDIKNTGFIPENYIKEYEKINIYKRISEITLVSELEDVFKEISDRFGKPPYPVIILFERIKLKLKAVEEGAVEIKEIEEKKYLIKFDEKRINFKKIFNMIQKNRCKLYQNNSIIYFDKIENFFIECEEENLERI